MYNSFKNLTHTPGAIVQRSSPSRTQAGVANVLTLRLPQKEELMKYFQDEEGGLKLYAKYLSPLGGSDDLDLELSKLARKL